RASRRPIDSALSACGRFRVSRATPACGRVDSSSGASFIGMPAGSAVRRILRWRARPACRPYDPAAPDRTPAMSKPRSPTSVLVLGGGMVGSCAALHLAQRGHAVTLIDRREPGRETSYGNAGIIQREAVEPYAFPREW